MNLAHWFLRECNPRPSLAPGSRDPSQRANLGPCSNGEGTLFELCAVQTQTAHGSLCETAERRTNGLLTVQTLPAVWWYEACALTRAMCVCVRSLSVHLCWSVAVVRYKYSTTPWVNATLFSFRRYVNSSAKACIWCTRQVYPKGEES